ncbi:(deoxy)nucleoside triphosphate pyrophosphohydrolase [Flavobacterium terrisoli]|uniref:(deoxy)nucleoside triphosphate pyrophosphohydrolase n=1 Tax=Flavobacterium terrisoli TaxID=3242195 RepID=UPI002543869C|nr:(deoxy)nucleoside triphosphate pyrophosphohydrolase [Flavobacterium buctense]
MKKIEVVAAVISHNNKILCVQRGDSKYDYIAFKYEFPGGKVEENETNEEALLREIREELSIDIKIDSKYLTVNHEYPDFTLIMHSFLCSCNNPELQLTEHIDYKWLKNTDLKSLDWAAADVPIVDKLIMS